MASTSSHTPSSSTSSSPPTKWDVFLSFRGTDTRHGFTSHLYSALDRYSIQTFRDDQVLRCGDQISDTLLKDIHESKIYIAVLSENYASSSWCLDELVEILNCSETMQRLVIPVFYNILPAVVRRQTGSFEEHFRKHESRFAGEMERVKKWRLTLEQVADKSGKHVDGTRSEAVIVNEIVQEILLQINPTALHVVKYPVGLDSRVKAITHMLSNDTKDVIKIGIYGMGGIGKTTLAKELFNQLLLRDFKGSCFLANVRENLGTFKGLESLQQQLINDVLRTKDKVEVTSVGHGTKLIEARICSTKILVVIDDLDDHKEFQSLIGPFASGSVVIITTRDEETLDSIEVEAQYRYKVNELSDAESETLFFQHAFGNTKPNNTLKILSKDILRLAGGLPLAIEVFGSYLYKKSEVRWKSYIETLQRNPNSTVQQRLMISLNALESDDPMLKSMFLDIACCFIRMPKKIMVKILNTYYLYVDDKLDILVKRCLLTINDDNEFRMHDLLRDLGKDIARNNSTEPGKHSRLWIAKDIFSVLEKQKGSEAIEVIMLTSLEGKGVSFATDTLRTMSKLRFLNLNDIHFTGNFARTLEDLRWFYWDSCPLKCLPFDFCPPELVILELPRSKLTTMWEVNMVSNAFEKLKTLNMSYSLDLTTTPDFRRLPCLEKLNLKCCTSLKEIHISIACLVNLVSLNLTGCLRLERLPDQLWSLTRLSSLRVGETGLEQLPEIESSQTSLSLRSLNLHWNDIIVLPSRISQLSHLELLNLGRCEHLSSIPELPPNLTSIYAARCSILGRINLSNLKLLTDLDLKYCWALTEILGLEELTSLKRICLEVCPSLVSPNFSIKLFQIYSGFEQQVVISIDRVSFPDWIIQSSVESVKNDWREEISDGSSQSSDDADDVPMISYVNLQPNLSYNYLGMILCFEVEYGEEISYSVMTSASNRWVDQLPDDGDDKYDEYDTLSIVTVPRSIFRVTETDHTIKFTSNASRHWIRLLYKDENDSTTVNVEDEPNNPSVTEVEDEEGVN